MCEPGCRDPRLETHPVLPACGVMLLLKQVDNPAHEDRWSTAKQIADRHNWPRRGMTATLDQLKRNGLVESMREDYVPSPRSDSPPRLWRLSADGLEVTDA